MNRAYLRGHAVYYDWINTVWKYVDNNTIYDDSRPCAYCGLNKTHAGHDACLGTIEGVAHACCGHGNSHEAYIWYTNGVEVCYEEALRVFDSLNIGWGTNG